MSKPEPKSQNPNPETPGGMIPESIEFYKLGEIVERANKLIAAFDKFVRKLVESREDDNILFGGYIYDGLYNTINEFAVDVLEAVAKNLDKHVEKILDCGEDGDGYLVRTTLGDRVLVLVFPDIYPPEILVLSPKEADWCEEAK